MDGFKKLDGMMRGKPSARRYIQWKVAEVTVLQAQDDPTRTDEAIKLLTEFKKDNPGSWQILEALKTLAKLQEEAGKADDARKTYEELADAPDVPRELKQESEILVGRLLLRTGKFKDAEKRLQKLGATMSAGDAQRPFVDVYLAESQIGQDNPPAVEKQLKEAIRHNSDARLRGLAYNLLGDHYRKTNKDEEAFWSYLRVDAMYNDDAEEQAKAHVLSRDAVRQAEEGPDPRQGVRRPAARQALRRHDVSEADEACRRQEAVTSAFLGQGEPGRPPWLVWMRHCPCSSAKRRYNHTIHPLRGAVAQLGERYVRNVEVRGSIPLGSTFQDLPIRRKVLSFHGLQNSALPAV